MSNKNIYVKYCTTESHHNSIKKDGCLIHLTLSFYNLLYLFLHLFQVQQRQHYFVQTSRMHAMLERTYKMPSTTRNIFFFTQMKNDLYLKFSRKS